MRVHVAFTTLNTFGVFLNEYEHVTNNLACVLRTFQNILQIVWSHSHPRLSCGSTFTCIEIQEQHIKPKVNTFYAKTLLVIVSLILKLKNFWLTVSQNQLSNL